MWQKQVVRLKNIISDKSGNALIWGIFLSFCMVVLFIMFFHKWQIHITVDEVSKDITNTLTSTASSRLYDSFVTVREGTSGAYSYNGSDYTEIKDTSKFTALFTSIYKDTVFGGNDITKSVDGRKVFRISDIRLYVENAPLGATKSTYLCDYTLTIYQDYLWKDKVITLENQRQTVKYINKF